MSNDLLALHHLVDILDAERTISTSMGKHTFGLEVAKDAMPVSYFRLDGPIRRENNFTFRLNGFRLSE